MRAFLKYLHDWIGESGYYMTRGCYCARRHSRAESIVERGRLSGRPFCLPAGTGWCAVSPSRRFLTAIGMDHWFNNRRLLEAIGFIPPAEAEERYFAMLNDPAMAA